MSIDAGIDLTPLHKAQIELDAHILLKKGLVGQDLLNKKILALQVELGELANEWQMFKFWKDDPKPNTGRKIQIQCGMCDGMGIDTFGGLNEECSDCNGSGLSDRYAETNNPLLEELADCLSFILSIGNDLMVYKEFHQIDYFPVQKESIELQFLSFNQYLHSKFNRSSWINVIKLFLGLGKMLGFTWDDIQNAYFEKRQTNFERQANGY